MAETANTASLGNKVSEDIFKWLKWQFKTAKDVNFPCETETHGKETHPVDVVFYYKNKEEFNFSRKTFLDYFHFFLFF